MSNGDIAKLIDGGGRAAADDAAWKHLRSCSRCFDIYRDSAIYLALREAGEGRPERGESFTAAAEGMTAGGAGSIGECRLPEKIAAAGRWSRVLRVAGASAGIAAAAVFAVWMLSGGREPRGSTDFAALARARQAAELSSLAGPYVFPGTENIPAVEIPVYRSVSPPTSGSLDEALDRLFAKYRGGGATTEEIYWLAAGCTADGRIELARDIAAASRSAPGYECRFALVDAVCAAMIGKPSEAERLLVRIVRECPAEPAAAVNLAALYVGRGMLDEARDVLANIPAAPPQTLLRARIDMLLAESIAP